MAVRTGQQFLDGLRARPREVWVEGRRVADVTAHPAFAKPLQHLARLFDMQSDPRFAEILTYPSPSSGDPVGTAFLIPRQPADMTKRRQAFALWAEETLGLMGRTPDFLNTTLAAFADGREYFARAGARFGDNIQRYYEFIRENDLFLTHALIPPQNDRSKSTGSQEEEFLHMGVVRETDDGLVIRGARMLATFGPLADEVLIYTSGGLKPGEERHAVIFAVPVDTPGLRQICRRPFAYENRPAFDFPLSSNFEECDSLLVFDDMLVPWERVFLYKDLALVNGMFNSCGVRQYTAHQTAVRGLVKLQFAVGTAVAVAKAVKSDVHLHVQRMLGEGLQAVEMVKSCISRAETEYEPSPTGAIRPAYAPLQAIRTFLPFAYPKAIEMLQTIGAGGLLMMPSSEDFTSPIADDVAKYYRGAGVSSIDRARIYKLAWDLAGEAFGTRALQYERYYAADPVRNLAAFYTGYDLRECDALVDRALALAGDPLPAAAVT